MPATWRPKVAFVGVCVRALLVLMRHRKTHQARALKRLQLLSSSARIRWRCARTYWYAACIHTTYMQYKYGLSEAGKQVTPA